MHRCRNKMNKEFSNVSDPLLQRFASMRRWGMAAIVIVATLLSPTQHAKAQNALNIAAVVNDEIISVFDLAQRINLVIAFSNLPNNQQVQQRIAPDVLRRLISEKLRLQEAKRLELDISENEINGSISDMEKQASMSRGGMEDFLKSRGLDREVLAQQVRAEIAWIKVVQTLFRGFVTISEQEVDDILNKMKEDAGKPEYLAAEVFLAFDEKPRAEVEQVAQRIHDQLTSGASWPQIAQNFSESASATNGGDLGWIQSSALGPVVGNVITQMKPGQISPPIVTEEGIYIVLIRDERIAKGLEISTDEITIGIQQLHLEIAAGADPRTVTDTTARAQSIASAAKDCTALDGLAKTEGSGQSGFLGKFKFDQLNPQFKNLVGNLGVNQISQPFRTNDGVIVLMVCSRETKQGVDPALEARNRIRSQLTNERLGRLAQQHEDKLRRQAFIDIRL